METACSPLLNSGFFTAIKEQGDIMACFVGHDHDNDYALMWYNVLLAYTFLLMKVSSLSLKDGVRSC